MTIHKLGMVEMSIESKDLILFSWKVFGGNDRKCKGLEIK